MGKKRRYAKGISLAQCLYRAFEARTALGDAAKRVALERYPIGIACFRVERSLQHEPFIPEIHLLDEGEVEKHDALSQPMGPERKYARSASRDSELLKEKLSRVVCFVE